MSDKAHMGMFSEQKTSVNIFFEMHKIGING